MQCSGLIAVCGITSRNKISFPSGYANFNYRVTFLLTYWPVHMGYLLLSRADLDNISWIDPIILAYPNISKRFMFVTILIAFSELKKNITEICPENDNSKTAQKQLVFPTRVEKSWLWESIPVHSCQRFRI